MLAEPQTAPQPGADPPPAFADLPDEVLALAAALGLTDPRDVASFAAASKRCNAVCRAAPLRLGVSVASAGAPHTEQAAARHSLHALCTSFPGTAELDLRGSPLEDHDVEHALASLPGLEMLQLSGCKKLTPALTAGLPAWRGAARPRALTLQRCFQLTAGALGDVLTAAAAPGARLATAALSHLSLAGWPAAGAPPPPPGQLAMLALHNCSKVGLAAMQAIVATCPHLEVLMLGGSALALEEAPVGADASDASGDGDGPSSAAVDAEQFERLYLAAQAALLQQGAPVLTVGLTAYVAGQAAHLGLLAARLPRLRVLELSFALPGLAAVLQHLAATEPLLLAGREAPLQVWDLCTAASLAQVVTWLRDVRRRWCAAGGRGAAAPSDAAALLHAAVNCSSGGRQTPLHAAADAADPAQLRALLALGAHVDARDRGGSTPLFAACEAGHAAAVECLLGAGASATLRNSAGEAPLYISALKGHAGIVDLLLRHFQQAGVSWQAQRLYDGDGWTPLMAAAVGGRTAIVMKLLQAAGQEAENLVRCVNRYGQSAVHIAARKGSATMLRSLVDAGGSALLVTADADGKTAADIARRNGNVAAHVLLKEQQLLQRERQRGSCPTAERPRPNDHRQQHPPQRWVGRRLQQRKGTGQA